MELGHFNLTGTVWSQINRRVFNDKIVRAIVNNNRRVGDVDAFRKNIRQLDFLFRIRWTRTQRCPGRIDNNPGRPHLHIPESIGKSMPQKGVEPVVDPGEIDIDRFHVARSGRGGVEVPNGEVGENASFESELDLQVLLCRVMEGDLAPYI